MILATKTREIFESKDNAPLPELLEGGRLPALFSGLPAAARAQLAAVLRAETGRPVVVICPDESAAESFSRDLSHLLGVPVPVLAARDYTFYTALSVSRQTEQRRLGALDLLAAEESPVLVATVAGLLQRAIPKQALRLCPHAAGGGPRPVQPPRRHSRSLFPFGGQPRAHRVLGRRH